MLVRGMGKQGEVKGTVAGAAHECLTWEQLRDWKLRGTCSDREAKLVQGII